MSPLVCIYLYVGYNLHAVECRGEQMLGLLLEFALQRPAVHFITRTLGTNATPHTFSNPTHFVCMYSGLQITHSTHSNCHGALCFGCGALFKVPIQIHIFLIEVPLTKGKLLCFKSEVDLPVVLLM